MRISITVVIAQISNGYIVSDSTGDYRDGPYGIAGEVFYATVDELKADAGRYIEEALASQALNVKACEERIAREEELHGVSQQSLQNMRPGLRRGALGGTGI